MISSDEILRLFFELLVRMRPLPIKRLFTPFTVTIYLHNSQLLTILKVVNTL